MGGGCFACTGKLSRRGVKNYYKWRRWEWELINGHNKFEFLNFLDLWKFPKTTFLTHFLGSISLPQHQHGVSESTDCACATQTALALGTFLSSTPSPHTTRRHHIPIFHVYFCVAREAKIAKIAGRKKWQRGSRQNAKTHTRRCLGWVDAPINSKWGAAAPVAVRWHQKCWKISLNSWMSLPFPFSSFHVA